MRLAAARLAVRSTVALAAIAGATGLIELLDAFAPVLSLGSIYLLAIVPIAIVLGLAYAVGASIVSMLALNFFFLPPLYTFTLAESQNWVALVVYLLVAVVVSELAARVRRRAAAAEQREREETLLADVARSLLEGEPAMDVLGSATDRAASLLGADACRVELGRRGEPPAGEWPYDLVIGDVRVGTLYLREGAEPEIETRKRFLPALASLLAIAIERDRLVRKAIEAEAFERSDAVKTAVLRAVSHDLRSPLTAIRVAGGTLRRSPPGLSASDREALLDTVCGEAERLERIVSDLLDLSRLEARAVEPQREICPLDELLGRVRVQLGEADARVDIVLADNLPAVEVDVGQLERVLANLIDNALKFSPPDERVAVRVTATRKDVLVRVIDHGPGIPQGELEHVFEAFRSASTGGDRRGSGLGLAIARGFAEANGGRLWAESRPGQGATFVVALPAVTVPAPVET